MKYTWPKNDQADEAMRFFRNCPLIDDYAGQLFDPLPIQELILRNLYGRVDADGRRVTRRATLLWPRKFGKTYLASLIAIRGILCEGQNQCVLSAASSKQQARRIFETMVSMIMQDPFLKHHCKPRRSDATIYVPASNSTYVCCSSGELTAHSYSPTVVICDEFHCWTKPRHRALFEGLTTGRTARKEPLTILISTQASSRWSLAGEEFEYCQKLKGRIVNGEVCQDGEIENPFYLAVLSYADHEKDDWSDEKLWRRINPGLDAGYLDIKEYRDQYAMARDIPSRAQGFKTLYLNMPAGKEDGKWMDRYQWAACKGDIDPVSLERKEVYASLDLAPVRDLSALTLLVPDEDKLTVLPFAWCSEEDIAERTRDERVPYDVWAKKGWIKPTPGNATDFAVIRNDVIALSKKYKIKKLVLDMTYGHQLAQELSDAGIKVEQFVQGSKSFGPAVAAAEKLVLEKRLVHPGDEVLDYCVLNVRCEFDSAGNAKPSNKLKARHERIDSAVALIMACGIWWADQAKKESGYARRARERRERESGGDDLHRS